MRFPLRNTALIFSVHLHNRISLTSHACFLLECSFLLQEVKVVVFHSGIFVEEGVRLLLLRQETEVYHPQLKEVNVATLLDEIPNLKVR